MGDSVLALNTLPIHPNDTKGFVVNLMPWLTVGETATGVGSASQNYTTGATSSDLTIASLAVNVGTVYDDYGNALSAGHALTFTISGAVAGNDYRVTLPFSTNLSETMNAVVDLSCVDGITNV